MPAFASYTSPSNLSSAISVALSASAKADDDTRVHPVEGGIVIVGAGMAGSRFAIKLATLFKTLNLNSPQHQITLISKEAQVGYNRIMLSPVLAGEIKFDDIYLYDHSDYEKLGIHVVAGVSVDDIDTTAKILCLDDGQKLPYDKLVLATGSTARVIPFPGHKADQVYVFRDVADVNQLATYGQQGKKGLVIGGGVLGLEAACALKVQGADMTVIHVDGFVLNRQLDLSAALLLQDELARRDVGLEVSAMSEKIVLNDAGDVTGLSLKDGRFIPADFIVMAVGIMPNTKLASDSGIDVNRGIVVDKHLRTSCSDVFAIGECVEIEEELFGLVSSVNQHVDGLISVLTQLEIPEKWLPFETVPLSLKLKVSGIAVFSAGKINFSEDEAEIVETLIYRQNRCALKDDGGLSSDVGEQYQCLYIKDNRLIGAVLYGETTEGGFYSHLINEQIDISAIKENLLFGEAYCKLTDVETPEASTQVEAASEDSPVATESESNDADLNDAKEMPALT